MSLRYSDAVCESFLKPFFRRMSLAVFLSAAISISLFSGFQVGADTKLGNTAAGSSPRAVALNPITNKIYVANFSSNNVTVIDGTNNAAVIVAAGTNPNAVAVNPVTNKIYVANNGSGDVTVIDGTDNSTSTLAAGLNPFAVAVNSVTNKIYVVNSNSNVNRLISRYVTR